MNTLSQLALEWKPIHLLGRTDVALDIFKHSFSSTDGLPPYTQARIIDLISIRLLKVRPCSGLWVSVGAPSSWYFNEIKRLVKRKIPIAILPADRATVGDLDFYPRVSPSYIRDKEIPVMERHFDIEDYGIKESALRVLRILARLKTAHTPEITSLAGFSKTHVLNLLKQLQAGSLIEWKRIGKYDGWEIRNKGLRLAHRSWNVPKEVHFTKHRGEFRYAGERHRRVARKWRAWLETAYTSIDIWECWTEVSVHYGIPDALAWGTHYGRETLFWLEVDSGHSSRETISRNYVRRLETAYFHAKEWSIPIVFCIMGPPWVVEHFPQCIPVLYPNLALIGHDWREFGELPMYEIGRWHEDLKGTRRRQTSRSNGELLFDPMKYPPKPKKETPKSKKPKSNKIKLSKSSPFNEVEGYRKWSLEEE